MTNDDAEHLDPDVPTERRFGWSNVFVAPDEDPRSEATSVGERATLIDFLTGCRQTLELKCQGLGPSRWPGDPSRRRTCHFWVSSATWPMSSGTGSARSSRARTAPRRYRTTEDRDADFNGARADPVVVDDAWDAWREEVTYAERCVEGFGDLGATVGLPDEDEQIAVREVLMHMVEEYARHCGHADLLRERIDGRVGV